MIKVERRKIYWFLIYPLAAITFIVLSLFFILSARGYNIRIGADGITFHKTGMLIISSKPTGAKIFLNGKDTTHTTGFFSIKIDNLGKDKYHLKLTKDGYYSWEKNVPIEPEMVTWANYILMFPKNPTIDKVNISGTLIDSLTSLDNKSQIFLIKLNDSYKISVFNDATSQSNIILDTAALPPDQKITDPRLLDWSNDKRYILFSGIVSGKEVIYILNTDSKTLTDFSSITPVKFDQLRFDPANSSLLYGLSGGLVMNIDLGTRKVSPALESQVVYYTFADDGKIYYVKDNSGQRSFIQANGDFSGKNTLADSIPVSPSYEAKVEFQSQQVAFKTADNTLYLITKTDGKNMLITFSKNVSDFSWSPDGERLLYQGDGKVKVFENDEIEKSSTEYSMPDSGYSNLIWYDSRHILGEKGSKAIIMDFDETNQVTLGQSIAGEIPFYSSDNGDIFFFSNLGAKDSILSRYTVKF